MSRTTQTGDEEKRDAPIPLHHYPSSQGMDMATMANADAWYQFIRLVLEAADKIDRRRAASHTQSETD